ncbi:MULTISPECIES: hypothetical protein [unclassified Bradyrhizobium]|uniref:hypothetical protein n=1 Tax=unclassified Bradyrhizobium TaxID=2631580 RepID=UPI00291713C4|nr:MULTISPECIES: hypothetical protein [unclassified Bradyrhizobium]
MPIKDDDARRKYMADYMRRKRAGQKPKLDPVKPGLTEPVKPAGQWADLSETEMHLIGLLRTYDRRYRREPSDFTMIIAVEGGEWGIDWYNDDRENKWNDFSVTGRGATFDEAMDALYEDIDVLADAPDDGAGFAVELMKGLG